jgi:hypothetical protein
MESIIATDGGREDVRAVAGSGVARGHRQFDRIAPERLVARRGICSNPPAQRVEPLNGAEVTLPAALGTGGKRPARGGWVGPTSWKTMLASVRSERQVADFVDDEQGWPQVGLELAVELGMPGTGVPSWESKRPGHGVWDLDTASAGTTIPAPLGSVTTSEAFLTTPNGTLRPGKRVGPAPPVLAILAELLEHRDKRSLARGFTRFPS